MVVMVSAFAAPGLQAQPAEKYKILNLELKATLIEKEVVELIDGLISAELGRYKALDVITSADMRQLAALEAEKQAMGCDKDSSCLAELAGALGARLVLFGQIGKLGKSIICNINLFDSEQASAVGRVTLRAASLEDLPDQIPNAVQDLLSQFSTQVAPVPGGAPTATAATAPSGPPPSAPQVAAAPPAPPSGGASAPAAPNPRANDAPSTSINWVPVVLSVAVAAVGGTVVAVYGYPAYAEAYDLSAAAVSFENPNSAEGVAAHDAARAAQSEFLGGPLYGLVGGGVLALGGLSAAAYYALSPGEE